MADIACYFGNLHQVWSTPLAGAAAIGASMLCGVLVGLERRWRHKPAGLRTVSLIAVGSTVFTLTSVLLARDAGGDPGRIAAQVVTGVGFLGAGAILHGRQTVMGLTTAASIWMVAAIGLLIGAGYVLPGVAITLLILLMLVAFRHHMD